MSHEFSGFKGFHGALPTDLLERPRSDELFFLCLDFDHTLAPIVAYQREARLPLPACELLALRIAVLSGRALPDLLGHGCLCRAGLCGAIMILMIEGLSLHYVDQSRHPKIAIVHAVSCKILRRVMGIDGCWVEHNETLFVRP